MYAIVGWMRVDDAIGKEKGKKTSGASSNERLFNDSILTKVWVIAVRVH